MLPFAFGDEHTRSLVPQGLPSFGGWGLWWWWSLVFRGDSRTADIFSVDLMSVVCVGGGVVIDTIVDLQLDIDEAPNFKSGHSR